jgi:uncharacterized membrane protein YqiK
METLITICTLAAIVLLAIFVIALIFSRLYRRASKTTALVRTGFGGEAVSMDGGLIVFPMLHEVIEVNMKTLKLTVRREKEQALITKDRMRVDVQTDFYVRVKALKETIASAAQTLGDKTLTPDVLSDLVEGKFVDALRGVAAGMNMEELHEKRSDFSTAVQSAVSEDLLKNGLELETVSLTALDQTNREYFNPENVFDAEGLTQMTQAIEEKRKTRNDIEQSTKVAIAAKDLETEKTTLTMVRDKELARLTQQQEIALAAEKQKTEIETQRASRETEAKAAQTQSRQSVRETEIAANQAIAIAEQTAAIAIAAKSEQSSQADASANAARALAVQSEEAVITARATEVAERSKKVELIDASKQAEKSSIQITIAATAERDAATSRAEAIKIIAEGESEALRIKAAGAEETYRVDAEGAAALNEAANKLSSEQIAAKLRLALIEALPSIIEQSVKPMESIEGIKILHVDGINGSSHANGTSISSDGPGNLADQAANAALRFRGQSRIVDGLLAELGIDGSSLGGLTQGLHSANASAGPASAPAAVQANWSASVAATPNPLPKPAATPKR